MAPEARQIMRHHWQGRSFMQNSVCQNPFFHFLPWQPRFVQHFVCLHTCWQALAEIWSRSLSWLVFGVVCRIGCSWWWIFLGRSLTCLHAVDMKHFSPLCCCQYVYDAEQSQFITLLLESFFLQIQMRTESHINSVATCHDFKKNALHFKEAC